MSEGFLPGLQDLVKDNGHIYFINYLNLQEDRPSRSCAQACFVLTVVCESHPRGQALCAQANMLSTLLRLLSTPGNTPLQGQVNFASRDTGLLVKWLCLCLGKLCQNMAEVRHPSPASVASPDPQIQRDACCLCGPAGCRPTLCLAP